MKSDDKKKMYDDLGIKGVYFEEMYKKYEMVDSKKKEIGEIREIMSSKSKFLGSVSSVQLVYRKIVGASCCVNCLDDFATYEAETDSKLEHFYEGYKARGYDNFVIDSVEKKDYMCGSTYSVEMHKRYDGYTLYATMVLDTRM